ncbi:insulinoma-associated protein 1-like [Hypanus sabinus]|uniref:insulinoma-associated protein 1-like n=1 Tax=Hypanus sabinus TaxID=79690 RepID=UPI0028C41A61|nr:insulinoma-associated protein 1-like [Hypanus sabinus]
MSSAFCLLKFAFLKQLFLVTRPLSPTMPRGFLVKRSRRSTPISYRIRCHDAAEPPVQQPPADPPLPQGAGGGAAPEPGGAQVFGRLEPGCPGQPLSSPARPVSRERLYGQRTVSLGSPVTAESFPGPAATFNALDRMLLLAAPGGAELGCSGGGGGGDGGGGGGGGASSPSPRAGGATKAAERRNKPPMGAGAAARRAKAARKLAFEDEVTTSPVLGLRIKEALPEGEGKAGRMGGGPGQGLGPGRRLGEFICQLCKEEYADPFALAQHKCSRIVRVDYRCPECDKVFSCPANLASHRRWHKPRPPHQPKADVGAEPRSGPGPEAERDSPEPSSALADCGSEDGGHCECCRCGKRFKRQAYLRKHLLAHRAEPPPPPDKLPPGPECQLCGENLASKGGQERHLRLHATEVFPCKYCAATFYSSPGLTRHINKCHPSENRQVILLQVPVRPAC